MVSAKDYKSIIENYKKKTYLKLIKKIKPYHFVLISGNKGAVIGSGLKMSEAKAEAEKVIKSKKGKFEDLLIVKVKIQKIAPKLLKLDYQDVKEGSVETIPAALKCLIEFGEIKKDKIKKISNDLRNNKIFFDEKFLKKNNYEITKRNLKTIAVKAKNNKLSKKLFVLNKASKILK